jgi:hypothetical protein
MSENRQKSMRKTYRGVCAKPTSIGRSLCQKPTRNNRSNHNADQKEPPIGRQRDQQNGHDRDRNGKPRRSLQAESSRPLDSGSSASILDPPNLATMRKKSRNQKKQAWRCR